MESIKITPRVIKSVQKNNEPITLVDETTFVPLKVETESDAMRACLHMILKHSADMFVTICEIVAEEYKLDHAKMIDTIRASPRFEKLCADDVLLTLGYFDSKTEVEAAPVEAAPAPTPAPAPEKPKRKPRAPKAAPTTNTLPPPPTQEEPKVEPKVEAPVTEVPKKYKIRVVNKIQI